MKTKTFFFLLILLIGSQRSVGQNQNPDVLFPPLNPLAEVSGHYAVLQQLDAHSSVERKSLDTIVYPGNLYHDHTILYALVEPIYLTRSQVQHLMEPLNFPKNSSEQTRAELEYLLKLQEHRTPEQVERVWELAKIGYWPGINKVKSHPNYHQNEQHLFFECQEVIGGHCTAENFPATSKLLKRVMNDMRLMEFSLKYKVLRARPYQLEPKLHPLKKIQSPSFASGHTLWAYIQAYLFSELIPQEREKFLDLAYEIGLSREVMGVHYPSDEEAARVLAHSMLSEMWSNPTFQEDFLQAKQEWN